MEYPFDVALSFAEEDRNIALSIALALELQGLKNVYYYPLHYEKTWGTQLPKQLTEIYSSHAQYAIPLLSAHYFKKNFAQIEYAAIRSRAAADPQSVYALPLLLYPENDIPDDVRKDYSQVGCFQWTYNPKDIAAAIVKLLGKPLAAVPGIREEIKKSVIFLTGLDIKAKEMTIGRHGEANAPAENQDITMEKSKIDADFLVIGINNTKKNG